MNLNLKNSIINKSALKTTDNNNIYKMSNNNIKIESSLKTTLYSNNIMTQNNNNSYNTMNNNITTAEQFVNSNLDKIVKMLNKSNIYTPPNNNTLPGNITQCSIVKQLMVRKDDICLLLNDETTNEYNITLCALTKDINSKSGQKSFLIATNKWLSTRMSDNYHLYELLLDNPVKLFFDIEYDAQLGEHAYKGFIKNVQEIFEESFGEKLSQPIVLSNFSQDGNKMAKMTKTRKEWSYHIHFISEKRFKNSHEDLAHWIYNVLENNLDDIYKSNEKKNIAQVVQKEDRFYDQSVYSTTRSFRMAGQSKIKYGNDQILAPVNQEELNQMIGNNYLYTNYSVGNEIFLVQELEYTGEYYNTGYKGTCSSYKMLNGDEETTVKFINIPDKKKSKIVINSFADILLGIPNDQPNEFILTVAGYCKKYNLKSLYIKWLGTDKFWSSLHLHNSIENKIAISKIYKEYKPHFISNNTAINGNYKSYNVKPFKSCPWTGTIHSSQHHSITFTKHAVKERCFHNKGGEFKTLYQNTSAQTIGSSYFKYILTFYYKTVVDNIVMRNFYKPITKNFTLNDKDIECIEDSENWVGDLSRHIKPTWNYNNQNNDAQSNITDFFKKKNNVVEVDTLLVQADLGKGKSYSIEKLCKKFANSYKRKLIITSRITYSTSILERYNSAGLNFQYYKDEVVFQDCDNLVIQLESLYKLEGNLTKFDLIILDECESVLNQFSSSTFLCSNKKIRNAYTFKSLMEDTRHVIAMDAFLTQRSIKCIKNLRPNGKIRFYNNTQRTGGLNFIEVENSEKNKTESIIKKMLERLALGEKLFGFISSKKSIKLIEIAILEAGYKIKTYHGDLVKGDKMVKCPNTEWVNYDAVLTTSTITIGLDFNLEYFDCSFFLGNDACCSLRDCFQGLYRIRKLKSKNVYYLLQETEKTFIDNYYNRREEYNTIFEKTSAIIDNSVIELIDQICEEEGQEWLVDILSWNDLENRINKASFKQVFKHFCKAQGYTITECDNKKKKETKINGESKNNSNYNLLSNGEHIELQMTGAENWTVEERMLNIKYKLNDRTGISNCNWTFKRYRNEKAKFYFDALLNENHTINDIEAQLKRELSEKDYNKSKMKVLRAKEIIKAFNPENKNVYTNDFEFEGSVLNEFLTTNKTTMKKIIKEFNGSSFILSKNRAKRNVSRKMINGVSKRTPTEAETSYTFKYNIEKFCSKKVNLNEYKLSCLRADTGDYKLEFSEEATELYTVENYINEVRDGMCKYTTFKK